MDGEGNDRPGRPASPPGGKEVSICCGAPGSAEAAGAAPGKDQWRRCPLLLAGLGLVAVAACAALAALTASEGGGGDGTGGDEVGTRAAPRRASSDAGGPSVQADSGAHGQGCHNARRGEPCHRHVEWAMRSGIHEHPEWYPGLNAHSSFAEFQQALALKDEFSDCPQPCGLVPSQPLENMTHVGGHHWCASPLPTDKLELKGCGAQGGSQRVKALTYNLFWWHLFGRRRGNGGSAGSLLRSAAASGPFDVMAFQEADDVWWPLRDAGMAKGDYESESALGMAVAWRASAWRRLSSGVQRIAEDRPDQWYGRRGVLWVRLQSVTTGRTLLFANHHGPLPVGTGGICGGRATAYNILRLLQRSAGAGDVIVLAGDFNADPDSETFRTLRGRINHVFTGSSFGGVDHFFSNCAGSAVSEAKNLGPGGSDHDALMVVFHV